MTVYRGDLLPVVPRRGVHLRAGAGNLVHQEILEPDGGGFKSRPARRASSSSPRRTTGVPAGQHGARPRRLYVDMYQAVIEHPQWMPPELKSRPDLLLGKERGRIWPNRPGQNRPENTSTTAEQGEDGRTGGAAGAAERLVADDGAAVAAGRQDRASPSTRCARSPARRPNRGPATTPPGCSTRSPHWTMTPSWPCSPIGTCGARLACF
ncbi:MAG: hypothetical protein U0736_01295 [Gemmataceae bacterium]